MLVSVWKRYVEDISGATAIEYGLIAALIGIAAIAGMKAIFGSLENVFWCMGRVIEGGAEFAGRHNSCMNIGAFQ